ncbi:MAG: TetR/AcrR family transcriptional regulator [Bacillota bacterium]|nr:TetR/AcrR family transcriptional regulator [Bacillota bacterium]
MTKQSIRVIRKKEILDAAKKVFLKKGFEKTNMEDIINETSLSKGGFYYYYKNTVDILHDLMREGIEYRMNKMIEFMASYSRKLDKNALAEMLVDKMLDESELMSIYIIYLQAIKNNLELKKLYPVLVKETLSLAYNEFNHESFKDFNYYVESFIVYFMNTIMLGCEIIDARENFVKNREFFVEITKLCFDWYEQGKIQ